MLEREEAGRRQEGGCGLKREKTGKESRKEAERRQGGGRKEAGRRMGVEERVICGNARQMLAFLMPEW